MARSHDVPGQPRVPVQRSGFFARDLRTVVRQFVCAGRVKGARVRRCIVRRRDAPRRGRPASGYLLGEQGRNLLDALLFLCHVFFCLGLAFFEHSCPRGFFDHTEDLFWTHVAYLWANEKSDRRGVRVYANFGDTTLHDQEISAIDVESDTLEDSLDDSLLSFVPV